VAGKGGVGKTTVSALLVSRLIARGHRPVLAVDADPNTCLDSALGISVETTVGRIREEARAIAAQGMKSGIAKQDLLEMKISESLIEQKGFDYLAMGRSEGPGCYCYANNVLKAALTRLARRYPYVVLDNEAGLENLSRRVVSHVTALVLVADSSKRGLETAVRIYELAREMDITWDRIALVVNRVRHRFPEFANGIMQRIGIEHVSPIPENDDIFARAEQGRGYIDVPGTGAPATRIDELLEFLLNTSFPKQRTEHVDARHINS